MDILVTGHKGYIGKFLYKSLKKTEHNIYGMDIKNKQDVCKGIKGKRDYNYIFHLAGYMKDESDLYENNVESTKKVIEYCQENNTFLIFTSSASVYGDAEIIPTPETLKLKPCSIYGESKKVCEGLIRKNLKNYIIFRIANVIGKEDSVFGKFRKENIIYNDGNQIRDFIELEKVVIYLIKSMLIKQRGIYNLGSGIGRSINWLYKEIGSKKEPLYIHGKSEIHTSILNVDKLKKDFL